MKFTKKRFAVVAIAMALVPFAQAWTSPEVALVLNRTTSGTYQVNRYDASTGSYLGSYANMGSAGYFTPISMQQTGDTTHIMGMNYQGQLYDQMYSMSTGQFLTSQAFGIEFDYGLSSVDSIAWMPGIAGAGAYMLSGTMSSNGNLGLYTSLAGPVPVWDLGKSASFSGIQYDSASGNACLTAAGATYEDASGAFFYHVDGSTGNLSQFSFLSLGGNNYDGTNGHFYSSARSAIHTVDGTFTSALSGVQSFYSGGTLSSSYKTVNPFMPGVAGLGYGITHGYASELDTFLAYGHRNTLYCLDVTPTSAELLRMDSSNNTLGVLGNLTLQGAGTPMAMTIYAAPEPSAFLALAPLAAGLIWRRRSRKN